MFILLGLAFCDGSSLTLPAGGAQQHDSTTLWLVRAWWRLLCRVGGVIAVIVRQMTRVSIDIWRLRSWESAQSRTAMCVWPSPFPSLHPRLLPFLAHCSDGAGSPPGGASPEIHGAAWRGRCQQSSPVFFSMASQVHLLPPLYLTRMQAGCWRQSDACRPAIRK